MHAPTHSRMGQQTLNLQLRQMRVLAGCVQRFDTATRRRWRLKNGSITVSVDRRSRPAVRPTRAPAAFNCRVWPYTWLRAFLPARRRRLPLCCDGSSRGMAAAPKFSRRSRPVRLGKAEQDGHALPFGQRSDPFYGAVEARQISALASE
jgi:hypothetical protein